MGLSMGCRAIPVSWSTDRNLGSGAPPPPFLILMIVVGFFWHYFLFFSFLTGYAVFCPFLNILLHRCHHHYWLAQLCPSVGPLELAGTSQFWHEASLGLSSHMPPLQSPTANTWTGTPNRPRLNWQMPGEKDKSALRDVQCGLHL